MSATPGIEQGRLDAEHPSGLLLVNRSTPAHAMGGGNLTEWVLLGTTMTPCLIGTIGLLGITVRFVHLRRTVASLLQSLPAALDNIEVLITDQHGPSLRVKAGRTLPPADRS